MQAILQLTPARRIIHEAEACLQRLKRELDALEAVPESVNSDLWDREDELALVRMGGDGCPHCD